MTLRQASDLDAAVQPVRFVTFLYVEFFQFEFSYYYLELILFWRIKYPAARFVP